MEQSNLISLSALTLSTGDSSKNSSTLMQQTTLVLDTLNSGNHQQSELRDVLQVKMESLDSVVKLSSENDIILPIMIDLRSGNQGSNQTFTEDQNGCDSAVENEGNSNNINNKTNCKEEVSRRSLDLIFVIDLSISMRGKKMTQLRKTIGNLLEFLNENDRMSVIGFNNSAQKLFKLANLTPQNKKKIISILGSILPMGLTNITVGLLAAIKELEMSIFEGTIPDDEAGEETFADLQSGCPSRILSSSSQQLSESSTQQGTEGEKDMTHQENSAEERVRSIFLLSDGIDDRCEKNLEHLRERFSSSKAQFSLNTFGYGEQHDAQLMSAIAGFKKGNFYYIEDIQNSDFYFADALGGLFSVIGSSLEFSFHLEPSDISNVVIEKVYGSMWNLPAEDGKSESSKQNSLQSHSQCRSFHFNEIYYGLSKQILLELRIPKYEQQLASFPLNPNENDTLRHQTLSSLQNVKSILNARGLLVAKDSKGMLIEKTIYLSTSLVFTQGDLPTENNIHNEEVEVNYLRVQCAQALQQAMEAALQHNYSLSQDILSSSIARIAASKIWIQHALINLTNDLKDLQITLQKKNFLYQNHANIVQNESNSGQSISKVSSPTQMLSWASSHSTQDMKDFDMETTQNIRRAFICKSRAYMEQRSVMINLEEYQNNVQKNLKKQIQQQSKTKTFSAEEEEEKETEQPVKKKKILIPLQRKKFSSMNVGLDEIQNLQQQQ